MKPESLIDGASLGGASLTSDSQLLSDGGFLSLAGYRDFLLGFFGIFAPLPGRLAFLGFDTAWDICRVNAGAIVPTQYGQLLVLFAGLQVQMKDKKDRV